MRRRVGGLCCGPISTCPCKSQDAPDSPECIAVGSSTERNFSRLSGASENKQRQE